MATLYDQVKAIFDQAGVPAWIWYPIAVAESGFQPGAVNKEANGTTSYGLFQLNSEGQGKGYSPEQLSDPLFNAGIAAKSIAAEWLKVKDNGKSQADQLAAVVSGSGHVGALENAQRELSAWIGRGGIPSTILPGAGNPFPDVTLPSLGNVDATRLGLGALGVLLILLALAAFLWKPAVETASIAAKAAAA